MTQLERRALERFDLKLPAKVTVVGDEKEEALDLLTSDICSGGAFFETDVPLPVGTTLQIDLVLPLDELKNIEGKRAHIKVSGAVIRATGVGMAICFKNYFEIRPLPE